MMDNIYIEYNFTVSPKEPATEILIAELGNVGFESFVENENGVTGYIQKSEWTQTILEDIFVINSDEFSIEYNQKEVEQTNWNAEWEKNFSPIQVDDLVSIRAPFHENPNLKYDIVIEPKMSFGTGHHETTHMMVQHLLKLDLENKKVLDMGCGTGILAIFAEMKGAVNKKYDVIIANINRNILLMDIKVYANCLNDKGVLLLSGFYQEDIPVIDAEVSQYNLKLDTFIERNNWVALKYNKL